MTEYGSWLLPLAFVVGYGTGSISPAALIGRARGIDLHESGSGNPGATNAGRVLGRGTGVIVGILDVLKGLVPTVAFTLIAEVPGEVAGVGAVLGHITSPFLRGRGGKGVATTLGAILGAQPLWAIPVLLGFAVGYGLTRRMGLGAVAAALVLLVCGALNTDVATRWFGIILAVLVLARHWRNVAAAWRDWRARDRTA